MMPMNPIGPPTETAAPVASDALRNAARWAPRDVDAARLCAVLAHAEQVQRPGSQAKAANDNASRRQRGDEGL